MRGDSIVLPLVLLTIVSSGTIASQAAAQVSIAQVGNPPGSAVPDPLPNAPERDNRILTPPPTVQPTAPAPVLEKPAEPVQIFDSERSRNGCAETPLPQQIQHIRFTYSEGTTSEGTISEGTTGVYSDAELMQLATAFLQQQTPEKPLTVADLCDFADRLTRKYVQDGYYTSRAFLPQQKLGEDHQVTIEIVEGKITADNIRISGLHRLSEAYIRDRIVAGIGKNQVFRYQDIDDRLQLLRSNPLIANITASIGYRDDLKLRPATMILNVEVKEKSAVAGELAIDNYGSESVGAERLTTGLTFRNPSGIGDLFNFSWTPAIQGDSQNYRFAYRAPLNAQGGTLRLQTELSRTGIIQAPFDQFNIEGRSESYLVNVRQPLILQPNREFALSLGYSFRNSQTLLGGQGIPFNRGPDGRGVTRTSVIRFGQDFLYRSGNSIWALQSQLNWGAGLLDATVNAKDPDSRFLSWLFQVQNIHQINTRNILTSRLDMQLANDGLPNAEQFLLGGGNSVRGYRQNLRSGDNGLFFSTENRIQAYRAPSGRSLIQIAPFLDMGYVWNSPKNTNEDLQQHFLSSLGVGLLWDPLANLNFSLQYGYPLSPRSANDRGQDPLQSQGVHFGVNYNFN